MRRIWIPPKSILDFRSLNLLISNPLTNPGIWKSLTHTLFFIFNLLAFLHLSRPHHKLFFFLSFSLQHKFVSLKSSLPLWPLYFSLSTKSKSIKGFCFSMGFIWFFCLFVWVSFDLCVSFVWYVCAFYFIVFSMICFAFVFIFYFYFRLWVCNANYVFDKMLLWIIYELWSNK